VKIGEIGGKIGEGVIRFWPPNELDLSFPVPDDCAKFHQIMFKIATIGSMTDTHTHTQTDRQTPAILLSVPCCAIAMGQIHITKRFLSGSLHLEGWGMWWGDYCLLTVCWPVDRHDWRSIATSSSTSSSLYYRY